MEYKTSWQLNAGKRHETNGVYSGRQMAHQLLS